MIDILIWENLSMRFRFNQILFLGLLFLPSVTQANLLTLNFVGGLTASQESIFLNAEAAWESVLLGYLPGAADPGGLVISAEGVAIDGVGRVLGSAGPRTVLAGTDFLVPSTGIMRFDTADLASLESAGSLEQIVMHEIGHVLGIGTLWSSSAAGIPGFQEVYVSGSGRYTGATGLATYQKEFNQSTATFIPVELGGGAGTANGHWNEPNGGSGLTGITQMDTGRDFRNELMTGWFNAPAFLSQTTIDSLEDIGYDTLQAETAVVAEPTCLVTLFPSYLFLRWRTRRRTSNVQA